MMALKVIQKKELTMLIIFAKKKVEKNNNLKININHFMNKKIHVCCKY